MTKSRHLREQRRARCRCGAPTRWDEVCTVCGGTVLASDRLPALTLTPRLRVAHGATCTALGEPHPCHCHGGVTHPCNCYES